MVELLYPQTHKLGFVLIITNATSIMYVVSYNHERDICGNVFNYYPDVVLVCLALGGVIQLVATCNSCH